MKRLLISALLAVLTHGYWLRSNVGERDRSSQGKAPQSVVISLATVAHSPVSRARSEPSMDAEPITQQRNLVPVAERPVNNEQKDEPREGEGPLDENDTMRYDSRFELEAENDSIITDVPIIEQDDGPVDLGTPKTSVETHETKQVQRDEDARNTQQQTQTAKSTSQTSKAKRVERENGWAMLAEPQVALNEPNDGITDDSDKAQPDRGVVLNRDTLITQTREGVLQKAQPLYKRNPRPPYPRVARIRGYEGTVIVMALVGEDGLVNEVRLEESSGHITLDGAALKTVLRWTFEPAVRGTEKVEMWVRIPLRFSLEK